MTSLLELKIYIKKFYIKNEVYITYAWKFLLALITISTINGKLGYMDSLKNFVIVLMASLLCSILSPNFIVFISAIFITGHLFSLSSECALFALIVFILMFLLYFRFSPKDTLAVLLTPLFFFMHIPYAIPLAMGLLGGPSSMVSVSFGLIISYMLSFFSKNSQSFGSEGVEEAANAFQTVIKGLMGDSSDNIPGVPSIGFKTAAELVNEYNNLDGIYANLDKIKQNKRRTILTENKDKAYMSLQLVTLKRDVPVEKDIDEFVYKNYDKDTFLEFLNKYNFKSIKHKIDS